MGCDFDKDYKGQTPPARAPASSQLIGLRVRVRSPYLTDGRPNMRDHPLSTLHHTPPTMPAADIFSIF